jgi:hypothetical protein
MRQSGRAVLVTAIVFWMAAGLCAAQSTGQSQTPAGLDDPVIVEALGFATMPEGKTTEQAHREALLDARRNALIQAHVAVEADGVVKDMRVSEEVVRSRAAGYVQEMEVQEAGVVPDSHPPVYHVRVRAMVQPLPRAASAALAGVAGDPYQPAVRLHLKSGSAAESMAALRSSLAEGLQRCGVTVTSPEDQRPALEIGVTVDVSSSGDEEWTRVCYEIGFGEAPGRQEGEPTSVPPVVANWLITQKVGPGGPWWQRVAVAMAQDVIRLWAIPRTTTVRLIGMDEALTRKIQSALGAVPGSRIDRPEGSSDLVATLSVAGDPTKALQPLLEQSGVSASVRLVQASMIHLTYATPAAQPGATQGTP